MVFPISPLRCGGNGLTEGAVTTGLDGLIYAIGGNLDGGQSGFRTVTTLEVYDPTSDTWTIKQPMSVKRSFLSAATATNGKIYAMGGIQTNDQEPVFTVEEYSPTTDTWVTKADMPVNRYAAAAVDASNGKIYNLRWTKPEFWTLCSSL